MGWSSFSVAPASAADLVASQMLEIANHPVTWTLGNMGATVFRRRMADTDRFWLSPDAAMVFASFIKLHQGGPCDPPHSRNLIRSKTSRMLLGFKTKWEPLQPPRPGARSTI